MVFYISRQRSWINNRSPIVEIAIGGKSFSNPDNLSIKYADLGEGESYLDPRKAVEAAIFICNKWIADGEVGAKIAYGRNNGGSNPFNPVSYEVAIAWGNRIASDLML